VALGLGLGLGAPGVSVAAEATVGAKSPGAKTVAGKSAAAIPSDAGPPLDLGAAKDKLVVFTDGKQHYVAVIPFGPFSDHLYYGDGKVFWSQRVSSGGSSGTEYFTRTFWEPRVENQADTELSFRDGKYTVTCASRKTELHPLGADEQKALLAEAKFFAPRWKYHAYSLSRDTTGRYFYVDQPRDPEQSQRFRLFAGMKGNLKLQKMVNVVSDSAGDIFATRSGSLRLVLDKNESSWNEGASKTVLVLLPVLSNHVLIYTDLGVYAGQRLGTPCDDL
jgi:hypothetical protein